MCVLDACVCVYVGKRSIVFTREVKVRLPAGTRSAQDVVYVRVYAQWKETECMEEEEEEAT